jgi:hypothetical protein
MGWNEIWPGKSKEKTRIKLRKSQEIAKII